jgi:hypothetical protein
VTPIYTELSEILQIELHRALVRQVEPREALNSAAARINALIERTGMRKLMSSPPVPPPNAAETLGHGE